MSDLESVKEPTFWLDKEPTFWLDVVEDEPRGVTGGVINTLDVIRAEIDALEDGESTTLVIGRKDMTDAELLALEEV